MKHKKILFLSIFIIFAVLLGGCGKQTTKVLVDSIEISKKNLYLAEGQTAVVSAQIYPFNAGNQNYHYESSDTSIATIEDGFVVAKSKGNATISVISEEGGFTDKCNVLVVKASDDLALNNYNNLNMPPKDLKPIYNSETSSNVSAKKLLDNIGKKVNQEVSSDVQSARNVLTNVKVELQNSIDNLYAEKTNLVNSVKNLGTEQSISNDFDNMQATIIDNIIAMRKEMLSQIQQAEQNNDDNNYTVESKNENGVTFVVIKNK